MFSFSFPIILTKYDIEMDGRKCNVFLVTEARVSLSLSLYYFTFLEGHDGLEFATELLHILLVCVVIWSSKLTKQNNMFLNLNLLHKHILSMQLC